MDILIENLDGSLWTVAVDKKNKIQNLEIDPYSEIIRWGSLYMARVSRIDATNNAAYVDLGFGFDGYLALKDVRINGKPPAKSRKIGQVLTAGQMVMVQVKTPHNPTGQEGDVFTETKASRVSMDIALSGRFMIFTPFSSENRVSKRIKNKDLRKNLKSMLKDIDDIQGCILRSSAAHCQTDVLKREGKILKAIWDNIQEFDGEEEPTLLMMGQNSVQRTLGDLAGSQIGSIAVSTEDVFADTEEWCDLFAPDLMTKITPRAADNTRSGMGLFEIHDLIGQFEQLLNPYVILRSGGSIIIEETAAMTVIDVNSGADTNKLNTNIEAAQEIARQLRIRNIGGIVMADFISMKDKKQQQKVMEALEKALSDDPCTTTCHGITELGVFEISRQRRTPSLEEKLIMMDLDEE
jgi:Rne/Rng family ribonuclease